MPEQAFTVSRFENRNGTISWRVSGLLAGVRIRRNFKTYHGALGLFATITIERLNALVGLLVGVTTLVYLCLRNEVARQHASDRSNEGGADAEERPEPQRGEQGCMPASGRPASSASRGESKFPNLLAESIRRTLVACS